MEPEVSERAPKRKFSDNSVLRNHRNLSKTLNRLPSLEQIDEHPIEQATGKDAIEIKVELSLSRQASRTRVYSFDDPAPGQPRLSIAINKENDAREASPTRKATQATSSNEKFCRICFDGEEESKEKGPLICPCLCNGSLKHIHQECLKTWLFQREDSDHNYMIGARCEICKYLYHIKVEKRLRFSFKRSCGDGFPNLLVAIGLMVCLMNLAWLIYKYITGTQAERDSHKTDPNFAQFEQNQRLMNIVLLILVLTLGLMFIIPMLINLKDAFFQKKVISIKFLSLNLEDRQPRPMLDLSSPQGESVLSPIGEESEISTQNLKLDLPTNHAYQPAANHSINNSVLESSVIIPLNFDGITTQNRS